MPRARSPKPEKAESSSLDAFARLGVRREIDLLLHLPLRYEDLTTVTPIAEARAGGPAQIEGTVRSCRVDARPRRMLRVDVADDTGMVSLRFIHFTSVQQRQFAVGVRVRAFGEIRSSLFGGEIVHPRYRLVTDGTPIPHTGIVPDQQVDLTDKDVAAGKDPQMEAAAAYLLGK